MVVIICLNGLQKELLSPTFVSPKSLSNLMQYNRYYLLSSMMGDELYRQHSSKKNQTIEESLVKRFNLLSEIPLDEFIRSGMPWLRILEMLERRY